jgi:hypothetical protein
MNVANGGPAGAGDGYMLITANGSSGPGSRLVVRNATQWAGDYIAAGITAIEMDLINLGINDLFLRLSFMDPLAGAPTNAAYSTDPVFVPAGSGWIRRVFPIEPSNLTLGLGDVNAALADATLLWLYHSPAPNYPGTLNSIPAIAAGLGVDNITAVPEPCAMMLTGAVILVFVGRRAAAYFCAV